MQTNVPVHALYKYGLLRQLVTVAMSLDAALTQSGQEGLIIPLWVKQSGCDGNAVHNTYGYSGDTVNMFGSCSAFKLASTS